MIMSSADDRDSSSAPAPNKAFELARIVDEMRVAQRAFFRTRSQEMLELSKERERKVDAAVQEILNSEGQLFSFEGAGDE